MTKAEVVEFLSNSIHFKQLLYVKTRRLEQLRETEKQLDKIFISNEIRNSLQRAERNLEKCVENFILAQEKIDDAIEGIENKIERIVLEYRYINDCTIKEIAEKLNYSERHVSRLHDQAIEKLINLF